MIISRSLLSASASESGGAAEVSDRSFERVARQSSSEIFSQREIGARN